MDHAKDQGVSVVDAIDNDIFPNGQAAGAWAEIVITRASDMAKAAKRRARFVMVSIRRLAISMLPLSFATPRPGTISVVDL
jgi:hypothetical protein